MKKIFAVVLICVSSALAGGTSHWAHTSEADFKQGSAKDVVATNLGDLKLSRSIKFLLEQDANVASVDSLAQAADKTIFAGTGPSGMIFHIKDDKVANLITIEDATKISSLLVDAKGRLLAGTTGEKGQIYIVDPSGKEKPASIFSQEGVQYIWAIVQTPDGNIYAATGPSAKIFEITPDGKSQELFSCKDNNILSLISDGKDMLFAGTDPNGLVYRINRKTKESFVMLDAAENEITSLALDSNGNIYASTGQGSEEGSLESELEAKTDQSGRPETKGQSEPIPHEPPTLPKPTPGQPEPQPKTEEEPKHLVIDVQANPTEKDSPHTPPATAPDAKHPTPATPNPFGSASGGTPAPHAEGNAVYKIDADGFVTEIFRQPASIMSIVLRDGKLLVATSGDGLIYQVDPEAEETTTIAKVDPKSVMCLLPTSDGRIILGTANAGGIATMSSGFATEGTFTSAALDATQISRFGRIHMHGSLPKGTAIKIATRSGNISEPDDATWSKWSADEPAKEFVETKSPAARFFQYRISLSSDGTQSPVVEDIDVAYLQPNQAPQVKSIKIAPSPNKAPLPAPEGEQPAPAPSQRHQQITWECTDPNNDVTEYTLQFRTTNGGPWILLKDKLTQPTFEWDTRSVADGRYEIRVIASDVKANPIGMGKIGTRVSDPVIVDNTAPVIGDIKTVLAEKTVSIEATVVDRTSTIAAVDCALDSATDWQAAQPSDNILDELTEKVGLKLQDLAVGAHQISIRATDSHGNQAYESVNFTVVEKK